MSSRIGTPMQGLRDRVRRTVPPERLANARDRGQEIAIEDAREAADAAAVVAATAGADADQALIDAAAANADADAAQLTINETLAGTRNFTGLKVENQRVEVFLGRTDGTMLDDPVAVPVTVIQAQVRSSVSATGDVTFNSGTGVFGLSLSSGSVTGALGYTPTSVAGLTGVQGVAAFKTGLVLVKADVGLGSSDDTADTAKPVSAAQQTALDQKLNLSALDTDGTLAANSDAKVATQKATKTYVDQIVAAQDAMVFKGVIDCSANPNYPAADRGWTYRVSVAGKIGGVSGVVVDVGDFMTCLTDGTASGNQATVGASWGVFQTNLDGAVIGPASATDSGFARFDGATGKLLKNSAAVVGVADGGTNITSYAVGDLTYASGATTLSKLAGVATGNVLLSGGVGTAPSWSKVGLTTHVTGTLPVANGGTGTTTSTGSGSVVLSASPVFTGTTVAAALIVSGSAPSDNNVLFANSSSTGFGVYFGGGGGTTSRYIASFNKFDGTNVGLVDENGYFSFASTTTASAANLFQSASGTNILRSTSSRRYKRDIETVRAEYADKVLDLRSVWYRSKAEADEPAHGFWGLIAEEVAEIDPRLVHYAYLDSDYEQVEIAPATEAVIDDDGQEVTPAQPARYERRVKDGAVKVPDGVQYERVCVLLLDVVRRQGERIAALEATLT